MLAELEQMINAGSAGSAGSGESAERRVKFNMLSDEEKQAKLKRCADASRSPEKFVPGQFLKRNPDFTGRYRRPLMDQDCVFIRYLSGDESVKNLEKGRGGSPFEYEDCIVGIQDEDGDYVEFAVTSWRFRNA